MCPQELSLLSCNPPGAPQMQPPIFPKIFIFRATKHTGTARSALLQPWGPSELLTKGSHPQARGMWGWTMPCSLLLLQGLWLWARLCIQSNSRQHQGKTEAGSHLGAMCITESLHPYGPLATGEEEVPRVLLPFSPSLGAAGYPSRMPVCTHTWVCRVSAALGLCWLSSGVELCFQHHPHLGKGTVGECKSTMVSDWMGGTFT